MLDLKCHFELNQSGAVGFAHTVTFKFHIAL